MQIDGFPAPVHVTRFIRQPDYSMVKKVLKTTILVKAILRTIVTTIWSQHTRFKFVVAQWFRSHYIMEGYLTFVFSHTFLKFQQKSDYAVKVLSEYDNEIH